MRADELPHHVEGGCHCGAVRFRVLVRAYRGVSCNCSRCAMNGFLHLIVPPGDFELLSGVDRLALYTFNTGVAQHRFCTRCGIQSFYTPRSHPDQVDVNIRCLDGNLAERFALEAFDGRDFEAPVAELQKP